VHVEAAHETSRSIAFTAPTPLWSAFEQIVAGATEQERAALFRGNAERVYRI